MSENGIFIHGNYPYFTIFQELGQRGLLKNLQKNRKIIKYFRQVLAK